MVIVRLTPTEWSLAVMSVSSNNVDVGSSTDPQSHMGRVKYDPLLETLIITLQGIADAITQRRENACLGFAAANGKRPEKADLRTILGKLVEDNAELFARRDACQKKLADRCEWLWRRRLISAARRKELAIGVELADIAESLDAAADKTARLRVMRAPTVTDHHGTTTSTPVHYALLELVAGRFWVVGDPPSEGPRARPSPTAATHDADRVDVSTGRV